MSQVTIDFLCLVVLSTIFQKLIALCGILFSVKYGTPASQGDILRHEATVTSILFISREAFRKTALRCDGSSLAEIHLIEYLGMLSFIIFFVVYAAMYILCKFDATVESLILFAAGMFEILIEPFVLRTIILRKHQRKVKLETLSSTTRTIVNCVSLTKTDPVKAYLLGRCSYALVQFVGYSYFTDEGPVNHTDEVESISKVDPLQVLWHLQRECLCNMLLSESENLTVLYLTNKHDIQIFIAANMLISFIGKVIFKVVEETCDVTWPQNLKKSDRNLQNKMSRIMRTHFLLCSLLTIGLITHPMHILLMLRCPVYPSDVFALQMCFMRIFLMGINGVLESFFRSYASMDRISQRQQFIEILVALQVLVYYIIGHYYDFRYVMCCSFLFFMPRIQLVFRFLSSQNGEKSHILRKEKQFFFALMTAFFFFIYLSEYIRTTVVNPRGILPHFSLSFAIISVFMIIQSELPLIVELCFCATRELQKAIITLLFRR